MKKNLSKQITKQMEFCMNTKKFAITSLVVFLVMYALDFLFHGMFMTKYYNEILHLLRPEEAMMTYMSSMLIGQILIAVGFTYVFIKGREGKGVAEGIRFGLIIGFVFGVGPAMINYSVYQMTGSIMLAYFIWYPLECMIMGAVASMMYKP
jgi:hypothetical protein